MIAAAGSYRRLRPVAAVCRCSAYRFPHREGGGKCFAAVDGPYCGACNAACVPTLEDYGYGETEFWGSVSVHRDVQVVSDCCEAAVYEDASLSIPFKGK